MEILYGNISTDVQNSDIKSAHPHLSRFNADADGPSDTAKHDG